MLAFESEQSRLYQGFTDPKTNITTFRTEVKSKGPLLLKMTETLRLVKIHKPRHPLLHGNFPKKAANMTTIETTIPQTKKRQQELMKSVSLYISAIMGFLKNQPIDIIRHNGLLISALFPKPKTALCE